MCNVLIPLCVTDSQFEERLVERPGEEGVEQVLVHEGQAQQAAAEPEPVQVVVHERRQRGYLRVQRMIEVA